jgi:plasmid stability protein
MGFSITPLLLHSDSVPASARAALRAAYDSPLEQRSRHLESAARILTRELDLECGDALELVGLPACHPIATERKPERHPLTNG